MALIDSNFVPTTGKLDKIAKLNAAEPYSAPLESAYFVHVNQFAI